MAVEENASAMGGDERGFGTNANEIQQRIPKFKVSW